MLQFYEKFEAQKILTLLARALPYYLESWHDIDEQTGLFGAEDPQTFNMRAMGASSPVVEYVVRPHVHVLCILAAYLSKPKHTRALGERLPAEEAARMLRKGIAWACDTHLVGNRDVEAFLQRKRWGQNWRSSLWAAMLGLAAHLGRNTIGEELYQKVKKVVAFEADRFVDVMPPTGCEIDTKLEENAQDVMVMAWALNLDPHHPHASDWERTLKVWSVNVASSVGDKADHSEFCGRSLARWVTTQTLYPDMTAENHGFFHPEVLAYGMWTVLAMAAYALHGTEPPAFLRRKNHQDTFDVLLRFCLPTGLIYAPGGQDLPMFIPRPFALAWGLWNNDPRALRLTEKLLTWMDSTLVPSEGNPGPLVFGFEPSHEGWELYFQSMVGFELAMLAMLPFPREFRFYSSGQIESAVDTRQIYPYVQLNYRRNTRTTRSVAWKALGHHPLISLNIHPYSELIAPFKAGLLGIPSAGDLIRNWYVVFHNEHLQKDGFDTSGRIVYVDAHKQPVLQRDIRAVTWGDEGLVVLDEIRAEQDVELDEQYLSPIYLVNDHWTKNRIHFSSGSLRETFEADQQKYREISCPSFWASVENHLLFQFLWGRTKGLMYVPGGERNAPPYWKNGRLDMLAIHVEPTRVAKGEVAYRVGFYVGGGKGPRPFKSAGTAGRFFKGLVIMDGKNTLGLD